MTLRAYRRRRRQRILGRLRFAGTITCAFVAVAIPGNLVLAPDRLGERMSALALQGAIGVAAFIASRTSRAARHATASAVLMLLGISVTLLYSLRLSPDDVDVLTMTVVSMLIGGALMFPWGAVLQGVVAGWTTVGYASLVLPLASSAGMRATNLLGSVLVSATVSIIGAGMLERSRRTTFVERRATRGLARQRRRLIDLGRDLRGAATVESLCELLVHRARAMIASDAVLLFLEDPKLDLYRMVATTDPSTRAPLRDRTWARDAALRFATEHRPRAVHECSEESIRTSIPETFDAREDARILLATLGPNPAPTGFLVWRRRQGELFPRNDRSTAEGIADQAFTALKAAQLHAKLREEGETLETIHRVGALLSAELDQKKLVQAVTDAATQLTGAELGAFFYRPEADQEGPFALYTLSGAPADSFRHLGMPRMTAIFAPTFRGEGPVRIADVRRDERFGKNVPFHGLPPGHPEITSYLAVPVLSRSGRVVGGLFFGHRHAGVFSERAERVVVGLAAQTAIAMDNAYLYDAERRARAQAESASRAKDDFLATLSHELRTPLNLIIGFTEMAADPSTREDERGDLLRRIDSSGRQLLVMIEETLEVGRVNAGRAEVQLDRIRLPALWRDLRSASAGLPHHENVEVVWSAEPADVVVVTDRRKLQIVIRNLVGNALKFTFSGDVRCSVEAGPDGLRFAVTDSGIGIPLEDQQHIFDMFSQAHGRDTHGMGGTGLGLYIVRRFVEQLGGTIRVTSAVGRGSTFEVHLPHDSTGAAASAEARPEAPPSASPQPRA